MYRTGHNKVDLYDDLPNYPAVPLMQSTGPYIKDTCRTDTEGEISRTRKEPSGKEELEKYHGEKVE